MGEIFTIVERLSSGHTIFYCHRLPFETEVIQFIWHYKLHAVWDGHILSVIVNLLVQFPIWKPIEYFLCITIKYTHSPFLLCSFTTSEIISGDKCPPPAKNTTENRKISQKNYFSFCCLTISRKSNTRTLCDDENNWTFTHVNGTSHQSNNTMDLIFTPHLVFSEWNFSLNVNPSKPKSFGKEFHC